MNNVGCMLNAKENARAPPGSSPMNVRTAPYLWRGLSGAGDVNNSLLVADRFSWHSRKSAFLACVNVGNTTRVGERYSIEL